MQVFWAHILCPAAYHLKVRSLERDVQCPRKNIGSCNRLIALALQSREYENCIERHECCMLNEEIWEQNMDLFGDAENKDVGLRWKHIVFYTVYIEHGIRMSHALTTLHLKYALWIVNGQCWIVEVGYWNVKTSNNSRQQCCKQEFEFWRGYNAIIGTLCSGLLQLGTVLGEYWGSVVYYGRRCELSALSTNLDP